MVGACRRGPCLLVLNLLPQNGHLSSFHMRKARSQTQRTVLLKIDLSHVLTNLQISRNPNMISIKFCCNLSSEITQEAFYALRSFSTSSPPYRMPFLHGGSLGDTRQLCSTSAAHTLGCPESAECYRDAVFNYVYVRLLHVCLSTTCVQSCRDQRTVSDNPDRELQMSVSWCGCWESDPGPW